MLLFTGRLQTHFGLQTPKLAHLVPNGVVHQGTCHTNHMAGALRLLLAKARPDKP